VAGITVVVVVVATVDQSRRALHVSRQRRQSEADRLKQYLAGAGPARGNSSAGGERVS
jgi:hypothetical protein